MARASLNFNEEALDTSSVLYDLYSRLYDGMMLANQTTPPDYTTDPPVNELGEVDIAAINEGLAAYSLILTKNSAYLFANAIVNAIGAGGSGGGQGGGLGYISRSGDSMTGQLNSLYGFTAGFDNNIILEVDRNTDGDNFAYIYGNLNAESITAEGKLVLEPTVGLYFGSTQLLYVDSESGKLHINWSDIKLSGSIDLDQITIGEIRIVPEGIFIGEDEFWHSGNSNLSTVDWNMRNSHIYGDLLVDGVCAINGELSAIRGFGVGAEGVVLIASQYNEGVDGRPYIRMSSDLDIVSGYGVKFQGKYIIRVRSGAENVVSFSAPGKVLNFGDSDGTTATTRISLQSDIYNSANSYRMVSVYGDGNFPNSLSAGCGNSGVTVLQTYYVSPTDMGIVFQKNIRLGNIEGPLITNDNNRLCFSEKYVYVDNGGQQHFKYVPFTIGLAGTTSLLRNLSINNSASLHFDTEAEFFVFDKPIESAIFSIKSENYKTRLIENALFFDDGIWIEGVTGGMSIHGNAQFSDSISSLLYSSGFAGSGWGVNRDAIYGGYEATFDSLTIRKKMRVYELEVQKMSITNGSLWVSDSCSGDLVEEIS